MRRELLEIGPRLCEDVELYRISRDLVSIHTEGADVMNKLFNRIVTSM